MTIRASRDEYSDASLPARDRVARLSDGQRQCLALVDQHLSSKEIAIRLGISSHTVDQRIRQSLQILGVDKRGEAARLVASIMQSSPVPTYQRLIHQPPYIDAAPHHDHQPEHGLVGRWYQRLPRAWRIGEWLRRVLR